MSSSKRFRRLATPEPLTDLRQSRRSVQSSGTVNVPSFALVANHGRYFFCVSSNPAADAIEYG